MKKIDLEKYLNELFRPEIFDDYCPNGLQIEGKEEIKKISFAVSATFESAKRSVENKSDALIVHHGLFWKFHGTKTITGPFAKRIIPLIKNDINLFSFHLPLDAHLEIGNAKSISDLLELTDLKPFGLYKGAATGLMGTFNNEIDGEKLKNKLETILNHTVLYSAPDSVNSKIKKVGIITGGANGEWKEALKLGLDAYITGEMSEHDYHESREAGIHMFAGGHHATEKFGITSLMKKIKSDFKDIEVEFLDSNNPA